MGLVQRSARIDSSSHDAGAIPASGCARCRPVLRRRKILAQTAALAIVLATGFLIPSTIRADGTSASAAPIRSNPPQRIISLNPSLTAIVLQLGRGETLVGVDDYSGQILQEVAGLPKVGGLFDPSLEAVVALRPDRVLIVAGVDQQSHGERLERLGLTVDVYPNEQLDQVLENIDRLGALLDREAAATTRIDAILAMRRAVHAAAKGRPRPLTLAVVDRSPLYVVGGETFLDEMLEAVGADNVGRRLSGGYPRASIEWLISARPELLLDMTPGSDEAAHFWGRWPSLPAVQRGRVLSVDASRISLPGPELDRALRELAILVHGSGVEAAIDTSLAAFRAAALAEGPSAEETESRGPVLSAPSFPEAGE